MGIQPALLSRATKIRVSPGLSREANEALGYLTPNEYVTRWQAKQVADAK